MKKIKPYLYAHQRACMLSLASLIQSPLSSLITILAISLSLLLPISSIITLHNFQSIQQQWEKGTHLTLFLTKNLNESQSISLLNKLLSMDEIKTGTYTSPTQALAGFAKDADLDKALNLLPENPLPGVITLYPKAEYESANILQALKQSLQIFSEIDHVVYDQEWVVKLTALFSLGKNLLLILMALLSVGISIVIANTIRLALERHKKEIEVLALMGATTAFIRRPFIYRGLWYGLLGACLSYTGVILTFHYLKDAIEALAVLYHTPVTLQIFSVTDLVLILFISAFLGASGARCALVVLNKKNVY